MISKNGPVPVKKPVKKPILEFLKLFARLGSPHGLMNLQIGRTKKWYLMISKKWPCPSEEASKEADFRISETMLLDWGLRTDWTI